jgi:hypothetical protein
MRLGQVPLGTKEQLRLLGTAGYSMENPALERWAVAEFARSFPSGMLASVKGHARLRDGFAKETGPLSD